MEISKRTRTLVSLAVSIIAAVVGYFISRRIISTIEKNIQAMQGEPDEEETEPLEDRIIDPSEIIQTQDQGNNGSDPKKTDRKNVKT